MSKITVISPKFSQADNLWNITKISQSGQSVGGQTEGYNCNRQIFLKFERYVFQVHHLLYISINLKYSVKNAFPQSNRSRTSQNQIRAKRAFSSWAGTRVRKAAPPFRQSTCPRLYARREMIRRRKLKLIRHLFKETVMILISLIKKVF